MGCLCLLVTHATGDSVGLYFAWLGLYTQSMVVPACLGVFAMFQQLLSESMSADNTITILYSVFFAAWSILFLSAWTRCQNELAFLWGTEGFEKREDPRPTFRGERKVNPETDRVDVVHSNTKQRLLVLCWSWLVSLGVIILTATCAYYATTLKYYGDVKHVIKTTIIYQDSYTSNYTGSGDGSGGGGGWSTNGRGGQVAGDIYNAGVGYGQDAVGEADNAYNQSVDGSWSEEIEDIALVQYHALKWKVLSAFLNVVIIAVAGGIYDPLARTLTEMENHRTETEWQVGLLPVCLPACLSACCTLCRCHV